jgi:hypothetical protein
MAEAGLFIGWGQVVRGREGRALEVFNDTIAYYGQLQGDGRIERFDVSLLRGTEDQISGSASTRSSSEGSSEPT